MEAAAVSKTVKSDEATLMADPADGPDTDEDVAAHADDAEPKKTYAEGKGTDPKRLRIPRQPTPTAPQ